MPEHLHHQNSAPVRMLPLVVPFLVAGIVLAFTAALYSGSIALASSLIVIPFIGMLIGRLDLCFMVLVIFSGGQLYIPGFPREITIVDFYGASLFLLMLFTGALRHPPAHRRLLPVWQVTAFLGILAFTAWFRGFGFRQLGGSQIGGMSYLRLAIPMFIYLMSPYLRMNPRQWKIALIGYCLVGLLPAIADMVFVFSGGTLHHLYYIVRPRGSVSRSMEALAYGSKIFRLRRLPHTELLILGLVMFGWHGASRLLVLILGIGSALMAGLTGFRLRILELGMLIATMVYVSNPRHRVKTTLKLSTALLCSFIIISVVIPHLPLAMQRSVSWIPGVKISSLAVRSASGTVQWRIQLWKEMLTLVPKYVLVGRGLAFGEAHIAESAQVVGRDPYKVGMALATHEYHNGPLGMLLDTGILGLMLVVLILFGSVVRHFRISQTPWHNTTLQWYHRILFARYASLCFVWAFLYGDIRNMLHEMFTLIVFLECIAIPAVIDKPARDADKTTCLTPTDEIG